MSDGLSMMKHQGGSLILLARTPCSSELLAKTMHIGGLHEMSLVTSLKLDLVESILLDILVNLCRTDNSLHLSLVHALSVKDLEKPLELDFLSVVSELDKDDVLGTLGFREVSQREEGRLSEALDGDVSEPDKEGACAFVQDAVEVPGALAPVEPDARIELELLAFLDVEHLKHSLAEVSVLGTLVSRHGIVRSRTNIEGRHFFAG